MANRFLLIGAICALLLVSPARGEESDEPPPPTDAKIKKMKIKELKAFISDRGLVCDDCFEKGDYIRFVKKNRDALLLPSKRPRKISKEPIADQWKKVVADLSTELSLDEKFSKPLSKVVASSFEQHARRISKQLHKEQHQLARTSLEDPFYAAMLKTLKQTANWQVKNSIVKQDPIRNKLDNEIKMFLTAVGADNVNPMYEKLAEKEEL